MVNYAWVGRIGGQFGRGPQQFWRANRSSDLGIGAKDKDCCAIYVQFTTECLTNFYTYLDDSVIIAFTIWIPLNPEGQETGFFTSFLHLQALS